MATAKPLQKLRKALALDEGSDPLSARVRRTLVETLYAQPLSLAIGAINGVAATAIAAYVAELPILYLGCIALSVIAFARLTAAQGLAKNQDQRSTRQLEIIYEIGAFSYAFGIGTIAAITMWYEASAAVEVLMVANALCYGVGICARNAGRPAIALGQLALTCAPIMIVSLLLGSLPLLALFVNIALLIPAMASITINVFKVLRDSVASAEHSKLLATKMQELARTDAVTGLVNRAGFDHASAEIVAAAAPDAELALVWLDLDKFKEVNDLLGHRIGDHVLQKIAQRLRDLCGDAALIARFGGDEFIILTSIQNRKHCELLASEIHAEIMRPIPVEAERLEMRAALGVAFYPEDASDTDGLMRCADQALNHAKAGGRAQTRFFERSMTRDLAQRRETEEELRAAILSDQLSIYFQPIVDLESGNICCFEALVRWFHPEKGHVPPDAFIPIAEESGLILTLGNWITAQACRTAAQWPDDVSVAVNLSPIQIRAPGATLGIINALREAKLDPSRLVLEVTESLFVEDDPATSAFIDDLSARGVKFALDDFGTGYSSLGYIHRYPFTKIKIDRSFVSGENAGVKSRAIIRAVAEMGKQLDMEIVAEGLETADQIEWIKQSGCTMGQGYHYSPAVPADQASALLSQCKGVEQEARAFAQGPKRARA